MKYFVWIIPPEPVFSELDNILRDLSQKYDGPLFHPHMTLLSNVEKPLEEIQQAVENAVHGLDTFKLSLGPISFSTTYHQSVFVRVNSIAPLMNLNLSLKKSLGFQNTVFMPHMSLLYGDHDMETREKVTKELTLTNTTFTANEVVIVSDAPDPINWKPIVTIPFGRNS